MPAPGATRRETTISYRTLLVHVDDNAAASSRVAAAGALAHGIGARLIGAYLVSTPALSPSVSALLPDDFVAARLADTGAAQAAAETQFRAVAAAASVVNLDWRAPAGEPLREIVVHARSADLVVIGQPDPAAPDRAFAASLANAAILASGRPVLVVPYVGVDPDAGIGRRVLIALDPQRECARAIVDALPLLARADRVTLLAITTGGGDGVDDVLMRQHAIEHLAAHGIATEVHHLEHNEVATGEMLLSQAADFGVDLVVMGAYGHTRFHERVLGGVTRTMLEAMTVPVLMAH